MRTTNNLLKIAILVFFITVMASLVAPLTANAETWRDYIKKAEDAYRRDNRDVSTIRSYIMKAADQASNDGDWQGLYEAAQWYGNVNSNQDAALCLQKAATLAEKKENIDGLIRICDFNLRLLRNREAEDCLKKAENIAEKKRDRNAMMQISQAYLRVGNNSQAAACTKKAESFGSGTSPSETNFRGLMDQAYSYIRLGDRKAANDYIAKAEAMALQMNDKKALIEVADAYDSIGNTKKASQVRSAGGSREPVKFSGEADKLVDKALNFADMNRRMDAISCLNQARDIAEREKDKNALKRIAEGYRRTGMTQKADECMQAAKAIEDKEKQASVRTGDSTEVTVKPKGTSAWKAEAPNGAKFLREGKRAQAYNSFAKVKELAIAENDPEGVIFAGDGYMSAGGKTEASSCYFKAKEMASSQKNAYILRVLAGKFSAMGNSAAADQCNREADAIEKKK